jgi:hypothetical protein
MNNNVEKEICYLKAKLNRMVSKDISLTDDNVVRLSVEIDNLLNILHSTNINKFSQTTM